jgi:hypothetical protein
LPLSIFVSLRHLGLDPWACAFSAMLYPLLSSGDYGIGWDSYVWRGFGLLPQLWGTFLIFPALAWGYQAVRTGRCVAAGLLLGACVLAHFLYGYMAALSLAVLLLLPDATVPWQRRLWRLACVAAVTVAVTAYFVAPFLLNAQELLRSHWEQSWKWDSWGWRWVLSRLLSGRTFDAGGPPVLSTLVAAGVVAAAMRAGRDGDRACRWVLVCFVLWVVLFFGRASLGRFTDALPLASGLHMHRFIGGVQVFGLALGGIGLGSMVDWYQRRRWSRRWTIATSVAFVGILVGVPMARRVAFMRENDRWARDAKIGLENAVDFHELVDVLRGLPPGRVHAGFAGTWGRSFTIGGIPVYGLLQASGFDLVGYLFMAMAMPGEWQVKLNYLRLDHLDLYNIRYLLAPDGVPIPSFAAERARRGRLVLYEVPTSGYFGLGSVGAPTDGAPAGAALDAASWRETFERGDAWLQGPQLAAHVFLSLGESAQRPSDSRARGTILDETVRPDFYGCRVAAPENTDLILKVTYHPDWHCTVDGRSVPVSRVFPDFMAVRLGAGQHEVHFTYRPSGWKRGLFLLALSIGVAGALAIPLRRGFARRERS